MQLGAEKDIYHRICKLNDRAKKKGGIVRNNIWNRMATSKVQYMLFLIVKMEFQNEKNMHFRTKESITFMQRSIY
jgi:hypothetical protein